jgi:hypothetical protein
VNRPESSDNESDPGTYEEQRIKNIAARKAKFNELQLKEFKEAACDKNEAKNISLLYNLPGVAGPSGVSRTSRLDTIQDFLSKLGMKPCMQL